MRWKPHYGPAKTIRVKPPIDYVLNRTLPSYHTGNYSCVLFSYLFSFASYRILCWGGMVAAA